MLHYFITGRRLQLYTTAINTMNIYAVHIHITQHHVMQQRAFRIHDTKHAHFQLQRISTPVRAETDQHVSLLPIGQDALQLSLVFDAGSLVDFDARQRTPAHSSDKLEDIPLLHNFASRAVRT
jgi:hypothetical protein